MIASTVTAPPRCEARTGVTPGAFGFDPVPCGQTRGLRSVVTERGETHYFCAAVGHGEAVALRNGAIRQFTARDWTCVDEHVPGCPGAEGGEHVR